MVDRRLLFVLACYAQCTALAYGAPIVFTADLTPDAVVPTAPFPTPTSSGTAVLTLNDDLTLDYFVQLNGLDLDGTLTNPGMLDDDVEGIHLHVGAPGTTGPIAFGILSPDQDVDGDLELDVAAGTVSGTWDAELRGQFTAVPEPSSVVIWAVLVCMLSCGIARTGRSIARPVDVQRG